MSVLLVDTNIVSILFNRNHPLRRACIDAVGGHQLIISFMSRQSRCCGRRPTIGERLDEPRWSSIWLYTWPYIQMSVVFAGKIAT